MARGSAPTPGSQGPEAILAVAADLVAGLATSTAGLGSPLALGVGSAGVVEPVSGRVVGSTDVLRDWAGTDLVGELGARTGLPTAAVGDVHAHGLGEAARGAGRGHVSVLVLAVGTGIGASVVVDGRPLLGARGVAGHAGHQPSVHAGRLPCTCGGRGHLEALASGPALVQEYLRRGGQPVADLREMASRAGVTAPPSSEGGPPVVRDDVALQVIWLGGTAVGAALGGLANVVDPDVVVVGGGVAGLGAHWWGPLEDAFRAELLPALGALPLLPSTLGGDAALLGAAALARELLA